MLQVTRVTVCTNMKNCIVMLSFMHHHVIGSVNIKLEIVCDYGKSQSESQVISTANQNARLGRYSGSTSAGGSCSFVSVDVSESDVLKQDNIK